jgi:hypothetical protein
MRAASERYVSAVEENGTTEKMQYSDEFVGNRIEGRMGHDEVTLNMEPPRNDALDGCTPKITGLRPRNLVRCADTTCIEGKSVSCALVNSRFH